MALNADSVRFLCELAVKRQDLAERSFDALNTRLAALFAFNSFLLPASIAALRAAGDSAPALRGCPTVIAVIVWGGALVTIGVATFIGLRARSVFSLPDTSRLYVDYASRDPVEVQGQVISQLGDAWKTNESVTSTKATCLNVVVAAVCVELVVLVVLLAVQLVR